MIKELTEAAFASTFGEKMIDVTKTAEAVVDIWEHVEILVGANIVHKYVFEKKLVEFVYRNDTSSFEHVLLPTENSNVFIVLVINLTVKAIDGYFKLDLNEKYGLTE
ncbi:MAG: hypothetical protein QM726_13785 [Chitinophagaceae bacterium]